MNKIASPCYICAARKAESSISGVPVCSMCLEYHFDKKLEKEEIPKFEKFLELDFENIDLEWDDEKTPVIKD